MARGRHSYAASGLVAVLAVAFSMAALALSTACSSPTAEDMPRTVFSPKGMAPVLEMKQDAPQAALSLGGDGQLRIQALGPGRVRLFEVMNPGLEDCVAIYEAEVRVQRLGPSAYLEMLCHFSGRGTFFSRALDQKLTGDSPWQGVRTPFLLLPGQRPDRILLNLVLEGPGQGVCEVRNVRLLKAPRPAGTAGP